MVSMPLVIAPQKAIVASVGSSHETPSNVRCRALLSPVLSRRMPALQLGLTDPDASVRLVAASQIARVLESSFEKGGISPVIGWLSGSVLEPRLYFKSRDPRLPSSESFNREKATNSARLGGLMVVQSIMQNPESRLRIPLATYFREQGLFEHLKAAREDRAFLDLCIRSGLTLPPFDLQGGGAIGYLMHIFKYSVAVGASQRRDLSAKLFPDLSEFHSEPLGAISIRMGILNTVGQIGRAAVEGERDLVVARQLADELNVVVGRFFSLRLPQHLTAR